MISHRRWVGLWWHDSRTAGLRGCMALLALAVIVGCSGPENGDPAPTTAASQVATVSALLPPTALPTETPSPARATPSPTDEPTTSMCATGVELIGVTDALDKVTFAGSDVGGLSALAPVGDGNTYDALSDRGGQIYTLEFPAPDDPTITGMTQLQAASDADLPIDGEGLVVLPDGDLLVSSEAEPAIRQYTPDGQYVADLPVPDRFLVQPEGRAIGNATFESLALSPSGQRLFTAVEEPLDGDGPGRNRLLRYDLIDGAFQPAAEYLYPTEADQGVSEIVAVSDSELLVLERGLSLVSGFSASMYQVSLDGAEDVSPIERLEDAVAQPASKELLVDVADCPPGDSAGLGGINPLLENYESMAIGPPQPDGRRTLIVGSDDNFQSFQTTRYLVFAIDASES